MKRKKQKWSCLGAECINMLFKQKYEFLRFAKIKYCYIVQEMSHAVEWLCGPSLMKHIAPQSQTVIVILNKIS